MTSREKSLLIRIANTPDRGTIYLNDIDEKALASLIADGYLTEQKELTAKGKEFLKKES